MKTKEELLERLTACRTRVAEIDAKFAGQYINPESSEGQEWSSLNSEIDELGKTVAQIESRERRLAEIDAAANEQEQVKTFLTSAPGATRGEDIYNLSSIRASAGNPADVRHELHERAKRAIESSTIPHAGIDSAKAKAHVERLLATIDDESGSLARRLLVTGSPTYQRAFSKHLAGAHLDPMEISALSLSSGNGQYAVPFTLDPTIIPTSDGAVNPYRAISRVVQISGSSEWKGVSSAGVTAHRRAEGGETADDSPTLAQPTVTPTRVDVFIPFSMELQQDWGAMQGELAKVIQDAKDVEEATSFTTGDGNAPNPEGLLTGATTTVTATGTASFASSDLDKVEQALGPRFRSRAQWVGNRAIYNLVRHFDDANGPDLWVRIADGLEQGGNTGQTLLGYRANEASAMASTHTTASKMLVLGDFNYFLIVDRIGMSIELVPHLFGTYGRPTGQRGFFAFWRNACKVLSPAAFRVLVAG